MNPAVSFTNLNRRSAGKFAIVTGIGLSLTRSSLGAPIIASPISLDHRQHAGAHVVGVDLIAGEQELLRPFIRIR